MPTTIRSPVNDRPREASAATFARVATWAILGAILVATVASCWIVDFDRILRRTPDDAYYYFKIAQNVASGNGPTFDGIHKTTGFQPLWMLCLVPVFWVSPDSPETAVRFGLSLQAIAMFLAGICVVSVLSKAFPWKVVLGVAACFACSMSMLAVNGMESAIEVLAICSLFAFGWHARVFDQNNRSIPKMFLFGIVLGIVMLARLDLVFLGAVIVAFLAWPACYNAENRLRKLVEPAAVVLGASFIVSPYLVYNHLNFGSAAPISGTLKSSFPHISFPLSWRALNYGVGLPKLILIAAIVAFAAIYLAWFFTTVTFRRRIYPSEAVQTTNLVTLSARSYFDASIAVLACEILLHALHTILFMKWAIWTWHFFPYFLFASLAIARPIEWFVASRLRRRAYWPLVTCLVVAGLLGYGLRMTVSGRLATWQTASYQAALWARQNTSPSDVFALKDSGNFGYFSQRRVINLDGVVNNLEFQKVLDNRKLADYFRHNRIKYLVLHATKDEHPKVYDRSYEVEQAKFRSQLHGGWSDPLVLQKHDEIYRVKYEYKTPDTLVIWLLSPQDASW